VRVVRDLGNAPSVAAVSRRCRRLLAHLAGWSCRDSNTAAMHIRRRRSPRPASSVVLDSCAARESNAAQALISSPPPPGRSAWCARRARTVPSPGNAPGDCGS